MEYMTFMHKNEVPGASGDPRKGGTDFLRSPKKVASFEVAAPSLSERPSVAVK